MATGGGHVLRGEQTNFIRGILTIEVSIDVMWEFVCSKMTQDKFVQWWRTSAPNQQPRHIPWLIKIIKDDKVPPMKWDVSVLSYAILNCKALKPSKVQRNSVEQLRDIRNQNLFHKAVAELDFEEYTEVLKKSIQNYKGLLEETSVPLKRLEDINNRRILDEETEKWLKELQSRDAARKDATTEEDLINIHRGISDLAFKHAALEKRVQDLEDWKTQMETTAHAGAVKSDSGEDKSDFTKFGEPDPKALMNLVGVRVKSKWKAIGGGLGVTKADLDGFQMEEGNMPEATLHCMRRVFQTWKSAVTSEYNWQNLAAVLASPEVNEKDFVLELYTSLSEK